MLGLLPLLQSSELAVMDQVVLESLDQTFPPKFNYTLNEQQIIIQI